MGTPRRTRVRIAVVCSFAAMTAAVACLDATQVTLVLSTDEACSNVTGTSITVGTASDIETKLPLTVTNACEPTTGSIGTFVLVPDATGAADAFAVKIVTAVSPQQLVNCTAANNYTGCIVARREMAFVPHTSLTLPIEMTTACIDVNCSTATGNQLQTCTADGTCGPAMVDRCPNATCGLAADQDAEAPEASSVRGDGGPDASSAEDAQAPDATVEDEPAPEATTPPGLDAMAEAEAATIDVGPMDVAIEVPIDAPIDVSADVAIDTGVDAKADATADATADAPNDVSEAASFDGPATQPETGSCVGAGTSAGVACAGGTCTGGNVCCIEVSGGTVTESCTAAAACNTNSTSPVYSSFACRNVGDCPSGKVCCSLAGATVGSSLTNTCQTTCPSTFRQKQPCVNTCECGAGSCTSITCSSIPMDTCGGFCP